MAEKKTYILGISCYYHDAAAALIVDDKIVAAAQEERFTRKKHDPDFPRNAIQYCLDEAGIKVSELSYVAFYDKPFLKFERILETYLAYAAPPPRGIRSFIKAMPVWIKQKLWIKELIKEELGYKGDILFTEHHESHAASAFFPSPFQQAAFLTMDGVGEWATTSYGVGEDHRLTIQAEIKFPHSLGLLYSAFTYYAGFKVNSAEYKVMGLAPYGTPKYKDLILEHLIDLKEDGSFRMNMDYFNYAAGLTMTNEKFHKLLGGPPRRPETKLDQRDMDLAASIQAVTEEAVLRMARHVRKATGKKNLCLAGGVALNCVANGKLLRENIFEGLWIQPAAGDAGGALGAALFTWYTYLGNERKTDGVHSMQAGSYLGPEFTDDDIRDYLETHHIPYREMHEDQLMDELSQVLADEKVVGWFQGRMEFGPRALGARSILGDARSSKMQKTLNLKIKFRESFRPFAPSILEEYASDYFDIKGQSPYMLLVAPVQPKRCRVMDEREEQLFGIEKLNVQRSDIPAVTHVDYSARVQTVDAATNPRYHRLISRFYEREGSPVLVNTSFNVRGEPIVCTPEDAYRCFMRTHMDYLALGNFLLDKADQPKWHEQVDWRETFALD